MKSKEITKEDRKKDSYYDKLHKEFVQKPKAKKNKWISLGDRFLYSSILVLSVIRDASKVKVEKEEIIFFLPPQIGETRAVLSGQIVKIKDFEILFRNNLPPRKRQTRKFFFSRKQKTSQNQRFCSGRIFSRKSSI